MWYNQLRRQIMNQRILNNLRDIPAMGNIYYVFNSANTYYDEFQALVDQTYSDWTQAFHTTIASAYAACTSGRNDVILVDWNSSHTLTAWLAWTKSRINVIWMDWWDRLVQQGAKITVAADEADAFVIKVTWVRNSFRNIKFIQASAEATALTVLQEWGEGNLYKNCSFTFGVVDNLDQTDAFEVVSGSDSATFIDCTFWNDTLLTSAARAVFSIDQVTTNQEFKSNMFRWCTFNISSSSSTATFIRLAAVGDILFSNIFDRCNFVASVDSAGGAALAEAVQTWTSTVKWCLAFAYPAIFNVTKFSTATSGRNTAIQVAAPAMTATGGIGITPTA